MPKRVTKAQIRANKSLPKVIIQRGTEVIADVNPPSANLGEVMPKPDSKGKVPAEESGELIVWDNRQRY